MVHGWCSHCLNFCRLALDGGFISCSTCGKVLGQVSVKTASNMKRNTRFKRSKRVTRRQRQTCFGRS
ncbi:hypothetical protein QUC31_019083 [Theobroma cacao]|uniref:Uncharacterized protein n=1 Tax=Theobroma cacao TaxID=3641 RepID=A0A061GZJ7_THECC|nr:Uncharacterized protein TCM_041138 [Theobroma cacao]